MQAQTSLRSATRATAGSARPRAGALTLPQQVLSTLLIAALTLAFAPGRAIAASPGVTGPAAPTPASQVSSQSSDQPLYEVEMVVFKALQPDTAEDWSIAPTPRGFGSPPPQSPAQPPAGPQVLRVLPARDYTLDGVVQGLRRAGAWQPVAHAAWVQTAPSWGTHVGVPLSALGITAPGLSGKVYLQRARLYLHLGFEVSLAAGAPYTGATYTIDEMRNVRPYEKQYYDHPAFGIIAVVRPIKRGAG